jgi:hypothetical protein
MKFTNMDIRSGYFISIMSLAIDDIPDAMQHKQVSHVTD